MNKDWSQINKDTKQLLNKRQTFADGITKLLQLRTLLFDKWLESVKHLSAEDYAKQPFINQSGYHSKTIAYSIFHVFRIEDIVLNTLINNRQQLFFEKGYHITINSPIITTGNELQGGSIAEFSQQLDIHQLLNYAKDVFEQSNHWLSCISFDDLKTTYSNLDQQRICSTNTVDESQRWLIEYWCSKDVKGLLAVPFSRHWIMHLEASLRIKNKLTK